MSIMPDGSSPHQAGLRLYHVRLPMRVAFDHAAASRRTSDSVILALTLDGVTGLGECAPRAYVTGETSPEVIAAVAGLDRDALAALLRRDAAAIVDEAALPDLGERLGVGGGNNTRCLLETALIDYVCRRDALTIADLIGERGDRGLNPMTPVSPFWPDHLPISSVLDLSIDTATFLRQRGPFHFVKTKASGDLDRDIAQTRALRDGLGPDVPIMIDANMGWSPDEAAHIVNALRAAGATLFEEPLPRGAFGDLRRLRRDTGATIMLDETVTSLADLRTAVETEACDAVNIRVAKCGGLLASAAMIDAARAYGIAYQIGVQVAETGPLIAASRHLAFLHPDHMALEAGQSDRFFTAMVVSPPPVVDRRSNRIGRPPGPGFGMILEPLCEDYRVGGRPTGDLPSQRAFDDRRTVVVA